MSSFYEETETKRTRPESLAAVRLLQGVIYSSDTQCWQQVLNYRSDLEDYFANVGLVLVVDENDGFAYLRQGTDDERDANGTALPRLFRRTPMTYDMTLLCILLRDEMRRWEDEDLDNSRCTVTIDQLQGAWRSMQPASVDDVQSRKSLEVNIKKLEAISFVQKFGGDGEYEIRRILKARLPLEKLNQLHAQMKDYLAQLDKDQTPVTSNHGGQP